MLLLRLPSLQIRSLVKLIELVEDDKNVGHEKEEINLVDATLCLVRANAVENYECKLHLKQQRKTHTNCGSEKGFNYSAQKNKFKVDELVEPNRKTAARTKVCSQLTICIIVIDFFMARILSKSLM